MGHFWPQGYNFNLEEVQVMLHTKYQGFRPCGFRQDFFIFLPIKYGRMHHEEQFCEMILNLGQWFRCCLKDFLSGALEVLLFGGAEPFMQL